MPLDINSLSGRVLVKLKTSACAPFVTVKETLDKIMSAKKPRSGVPGDLPCAKTKEFAEELSVPLCSILNNIFQSAEWPDHWKKEYITPLEKCHTQNLRIT